MTIKSLKNSERTRWQKKEDNHRHCKMGFASKNSKNTIRIIVSRVQHVKECKNYIWLNYRSKIVWAIFPTKRRENPYEITNVKVRIKHRNSYENTVEIRTKMQCKICIVIRSKNKQCIPILFVAKRGENSYGNS